MPRSAKAPHERYTGLRRALARSYEERNREADPVKKGALRFLAHTYDVDLALRDLRRVLRTAALTGKLDPNDKAAWDGLRLAIKAMMPEGEA